MTFLAPAHWWWSQGLRAKKSPSACEPGPRPLGAGLGRTAGRGGQAQLTHFLRAQPLQGWVWGGEHARLPDWRGWNWPLAPGYRDSWHQAHPGGAGRAGAPQQAELQALAGLAEGAHGRRCP